jgi:CRP-like cAMP-binding protein
LAGGALAGGAAAGALAGGGPAEQAESAAGDAPPALPLMQRILFLRRVPLFAGLPPTDLKRLAAITGERRYADGATIVRQGEPGDEMYIVVAGEVRVLVESSGAPTVEVARCVAGDHVGEMTIISQEPRVASLLAAGAVRVLVIGQQPFAGVLREQPDTRLALLRELCARLGRHGQAGASA